MNKKCCKLCIHAVPSEYVYKMNGVYHVRFRCKYVPEHVLKDTDSCNVFDPRTETQETKSAVPETSEHQVIGRLKGQKQIAEIMGVSQSTISRWMRAGILEGCYEKRGKRPLFDTEKILSLVKTLKNDSIEDLIRPIIKEQIKDNDMLDAFKILLTPLIKEVVMTTIEENQQSQQKEPIDDSGVTSEEVADRSLAYGQKALAEKLGVTQSTISRWQSAGKLSGCFCRVGKNVVYDLDLIWEKFVG